jgi:hypothetical protein
MPSVCGSIFFTRMVGRPVAVEDLVRQPAPRARPRLSPAPELGARLGLGLALHQRFGLGEEVGEQDRVMVADRVVESGRAMKSHGTSRVLWWISW